jgi:hypothetical protein
MSAPWKENDRVWFESRLWPVPDAESVAHAFFEVACDREPLPKFGGELRALIGKYTAKNESGSAQ